MTSANKALLVALVLQVGLIAAHFVWGEQSSLAVKGREVLLPDLSASAVTSVHVWGPSKDGDGQEEVELTRSGDGWVVGGADDFPAKGSDIDAMLEKLVGLKSREQVLTGSSYHEKLEVADDEYRRKIVLSTGSDETTIYFGTSPKFGSLHVRVGGEDAVYQVSGLSESDVGARAWNWVDRSYVKVPKDQIWSLTLTNAHGTVQLDKDPATGAWAMLGAEGELDTDKVKQLVDDVREIGLESPVGKAAKPEMKLGEAATLKLVTGTSTATGMPPQTVETLAVQLGEVVAEGEDRRFLKASSSEYVVEVANWEVKKLLDTETSGLVKAEEPSDEDAEGVTPEGMLPPEDEAPEAEEVPAAPEATETAPEAEEAPAATETAPEAEEAPEATEAAPEAEEAPEAGAAPTATSSAAAVSAPAEEAPDAALEAEVEIEAGDEAADVGPGSSAGAAEAATSTVTTTSTAS